LRLGLPRSLFSSVFRLKCSHFLSLSTPIHVILFDLITHIIFEEEYKL
jgi:hypothetical protein